MKNSIIPTSFEEWRHCIIVECGLELTPSFIEERIISLQNLKLHHSQQFLKRYGQAHHQRVIGWFKKAQELV